MYSSSADFLLLLFIIAVPVLLILLLGLIFSIVLLVRQKKSRGLEITAWIFNSLWFIFDMFMSGAGVFKKEGFSNFFIFPILLTYFLLLQYRANLNSGKQLKRWYIAKTGVILLLYYQFNFQVINFIYGRYYDMLKSYHLLPVVQIVNMVIILLISIVVAFRYLKRIGQPAVSSDILKNTAIFLICIYVASDVVERIIGFVEIWGLGDIRDMYISKIYFNPMSILMAIGYTLLYTVLGTLITGYIYLQHAKKDKAELTA